ncbi:hypothetical protein [Amycolatopsis saalfeldensis]|uniref:Uncharacterized protein n=1 Tax=Amycolatopsis saalfeldensis TaxID=394193 RepID=A0A1H8YNP5_9PSEU|nr:hypothetical protein [Amycolatopsis saalfeldensis]SEP53800.1 hypothetical protein SAMN04489732_13139 [Amycolatopsis saalfeldensis]
MTTSDEIGRRVTANDVPLTEQRTLAAQRIGDLAQQHAAVAHQLAALERELGEVLAESTGIIRIDELADFTDIPAADLTRWLDALKPAAAKRKKATGNAPATKRAVVERKPSAAATPTAGKESILRSRSAGDTPARDMAQVS